MGGSRPGSSPGWEALPQRPPRQRRKRTSTEKEPARGGGCPPRGAGDEAEEGPGAKPQFPPPPGLGSAASSSPNVLEIDGAQLEGGGQILRNTAALAAITGRSVRVRRIRQGRSRPGLRPQHACGLQLVRELCGGELQGCEVGSSEMRLVPGVQGVPSGGSFEADTRTAGSCTLMLQAALPCLLLAAPLPGLAPLTSVILRGGTNNPQAPPVDYLRYVLLPVLSYHCGAIAHVELRRRGFYPKGGGEVYVEAHPVGEEGLRPLALSNPGAVERVELWAWHAGAVTAEVAGEMVEAARGHVRAALGAEVEITVPPVERVPGPRKRTGDGAGLLVRAATVSGGILGGTALMERGSKTDPAELGDRAAGQVTGALAVGAAVDEYMQDQLIIYMALARGTSRVAMGEPTLHTRTAIAVMEQVLGDQVRFHIAPPPNGASGPYIVSCKGAGLAAAGPQA